VVWDETINFGGQEVKEQGHRKSKLDLEASFLIPLGRLGVVVLVVTE